jgi:quercetin dioxygenase-like cupin family protein
MTSTMKKRFGAALGVAAVAAISYAAGVAQGKAVNSPLSSLKWVPAGPGSPIQIATLWGDREKGPEYGMLLKMPAGSEAGRHSHTGAYHAVNVQGTWVHTNDGDPKPHELPPGSYAMQPGKAVHNDMCKGTTECIIFVHQHAAGDFIPAK